MRNESQLNTYLGGVLKAQCKVFHRKLSDRFQAGMSDFMVIHNGNTFFIETKFVQKAGVAMGHTFSPSQYSFMKQAADHGAVCLGMIACGELGKAVILKPDAVKELVGKKPRFNSLLEETHLIVDIGKVEMQKVLMRIFNRELF